MTAKIILTGSLKSYAGGEKIVQVESGCSVRESLIHLGVPPEIIALVLVNEKHQTKDYVIQDGDSVQVMAVIGGG